MTYYHFCEHCGKPFRTDFFLRLHLKAHAAGLVHGAPSAPGKATDSVEVQQFAEHVAAAAQTDAGERRGTP